MKQYLCCLLLLFVSINAFCQKNIQSELDELNKTMGKSALYDQRKDQIISRLQQNLDPSTPLKLFEGYRGLYEEYKVFNYDSATVIPKSYSALPYRHTMIRFLTMSK